MAIKVKKQFENVVIGFNNSSKPLGQRDDLHILCEIAKASKRRDYLDMFETTEETDKEKENRFNEKQRDKSNNKQSD